MCKDLNMSYGPVIILKDEISKGEQTLVLCYNSKNAYLKSNGKLRLNVGRLPLPLLPVCFDSLIIAHCIFMTFSEEMQIGTWI